MVEVSLPTIDALEKIFAYYLERHGAELGKNSDVALRPLAEAAFGKTGADVNLAVRGAIRRARLPKRAICQDDLLAEQYSRPLQNDFARPLHGEGLRRVAIHEAGHALLCLEAGESLGGIAYLSITPRPDGSLGFMATRPNSDVSMRTRADCMALMTMMLGGGACSDLAKAMSLALALGMVCRFGLGNGLPLRWREEPNGSDMKEAEALLVEAYDQAKSIIAAKRETMERIANALVEHQELSGEELGRLLEES
ncbi:hypothetical protein [Oceanidesulfovibrio marinus]|uniref:hypothetical protein n=1 Tax=Oceanidesulfovibrio marinus TaxID=370038 RepID=UPI0022A8637F|nr:hypothetical protein [Oceanidesulfovibrio marinus]